MPGPSEKKKDEGETTQAVNTWSVRSSSQASSLCASANRRVVQTLQMRARSVYVCWLCQKQEQELVPAKCEQTLINRGLPIVTSP